MENIIDVTSVPAQVRDDMARTILTAAVAYFEQPGVEDAFQAWLVEYKKRKLATSVAST